MKKAKFKLNSIFSFCHEMVQDNGEDSFCHAVDNDDFLIGAFDGCGGSGSKKYQNYSGKTGAYIASRAVSGSVMQWFNESRNSVEFGEYILRSLNVCKSFADSSGRILGSLGKSFPTTAAVVCAAQSENVTKATMYWAGDSRCYMLDEKGLHQLTLDDLDTKDAMSNLSDDGIMTNVISADSPFEIHIKTLELTRPCILLCATDGCFGYISSPMGFEYLLTDSLMKSKSICEWKCKLSDSIKEIAGDDYTMSVAICGFAKDNFSEVKAMLRKRNEFVLKNYIETQRDVNELWDIYKKDYEFYI